MNIFDKIFSGKVYALLNIKSNRKVSETVSNFINLLTIWVFHRLLNLFIF